MLIPQPYSPTKLLQDLEQEIKTDIADCWLFPPRRAVSGFCGTGPITIIGWRPTHSPFPDEGANRFFYDILTEFGLENVHLTNAVKSRRHLNEPDPENFEPHERVFWRELEIVQGLHAVVPMDMAYDRIATLLQKRGAKPLFRISSYYSMSRGPAAIAKFREEISQLVTMARNRRLIR